MAAARMRVSQGSFASAWRLKGKVKELLFSAEEKLTDPVPGFDLTIACVKSVQEYGLSSVHGLDLKCEKGNSWMPWHIEAMKDVTLCDKLRGAGSRL